MLHVCELLYALELLTNCPSCFFLKRNVGLYVVYFVLVGQRFEINIFQFELFRCIFPYRQDFLVWYNSHKGFDLRLLLTIEQRLALSLRGQRIPCPTCSLWLDEAAGSVYWTKWSRCQNLIYFFLIGSDFQTLVSIFYSFYHMPLRQLVLCTLILLSLY